MHRNHALLLVILALGVVILACGNGNAAEETAQALSEAISETAGASAGEASPEPGGESLTAQAKATEQAAIAEETAQASEALSEEAKAATATAVAPIKAELSFYGVDKDKGRVAWIHPPVTLDVEGYQQSDYANEFQGVVARDFVFSSDITWNTDYGSSGCGYMFRSDGNQDDPSQYMAFISRGGNGHVVFLVLNEGEIAGGYDLYPGTEDESFDWHNDATNKFTVIGRGELFDIYTNGTWIGQVDVTKPPQQPPLPPQPEMPLDTSNSEVMQQFNQDMEEFQKQVEQIMELFQLRMTQFQPDTPLYEKGFVAMLTFSESGRTICEFDNAWLWLIEE